MSKPVSLPTIHLAHAPDAVDRAQWIDSTTAYQAMLDHLATMPQVGIDTEFVRERTFYPAPGLVQVSDGQRVWLVDVVTLKDHHPMSALMQATHTEKVLHSVGEDLEILSLLTDHYPLPLIDTQMAAAYLGFPLQMRYEHLVEVVFAVTLPGGQARSNWCQRPLSHALLSYAAQDVIYLPKLAEVLQTQLERLGRLAWLIEDCQRLVEQKDINVDPVLRIKGVGRLSANAMAYAASLATWRDDQARRRNLPRSFVLKDDVLLALATDAERLGPAHAVRDLQSTLKRAADPCRQALEMTRVEEFNVPAELIALTTEQKQLLKTWQAKVAKLAESLNVDPGVVASKRELTRLIRGQRPGWLNGWRGDFLDEALGLSSFQP